MVSKVRQALFSHVYVPLEGFALPFVIHKCIHVNQSWLTNQQGAQVATTTKGYITIFKFQMYFI